MFAHRPDTTCEIAPILGSRALAKRAVAWEDPLLPKERIGLGFRFGNGRRGWPRISGLPIYCLGDDRPAYNLLPVQAEGGAGQPAEGRAGETTRSLDSESWMHVQPGDLNPQHPLWAGARAGASADFGERLRVQLRDRLVSLLERVQQEGEDGKLALQLLELALKDPDRFVVERALQGSRLGRFLHSVRHRSEWGALTLRNFLPDGEVVRLLPAGRRRPKRHRDFPDLLEWSASLASATRRVLEKMVYIPPLRESPKRHELIQARPPGLRDKSARSAPDLLFTQRGLMEQTNVVLKELGLGHALEVPTAGRRDDAQLLALALLDERSGTRVSWADAGFGVSQVLPIIVHSLRATDRILLVEQPEIHLRVLVQYLSDTSPPFCQVVGSSVQGTLLA